MSDTVDLDAEATAADLSQLAAEYASALGDLPWDARPARTGRDRAALVALHTELERLLADPDSDDDRLTIAEWRAELGLCPDGDPHFVGRMCRAHECPTQRTADYEAFVDETGRLR